MKINNQINNSTRALLRPAYRMVRSWFIGDEDTMWNRIVVNRETDRLLQALPVRLMHACEVSGHRWEHRLPFASYSSVHFPKVDICMQHLDKCYDLVIAEHVFEHLANPRRAGINIHASLSPGGWFLITTPFMIRYHPHPIDCSRWTETGMRYFLADCGFVPESIRTGSWGNRKCVISGMRWWRRYWPWVHSLKNDPRFPLVVWAMAQRSG